MINRNYTVKFKRKRKHLTDYAQRLRLLSARKPRFVVRKSLNNVQIQLVTFEPAGDKTLLTTSSTELTEYGWKAHRGNIPSAYLTGYLCGLKAKKQGIKEAVLDLGFHKAVPGSSPFAALKGAVDAGLAIPHGESILPTQETLSGKTISSYSAKASPLQFSATLKKGLDPKNLPAHIEEVKKTITTKWH